MTYLSWETFGELFTSVQRTALRLEVRERYNTDVDQEAQRQFRAGEPVDLGWAQDWLEMVRKATSEGKVFCRVRVVNVPLSEYNRYGIWFAEHTIAAGEDIRYLDRAQAAGLPDFDYWLLDSDKVVKLHFDADDRPVTAEAITDAAVVNELAAALDRAIARSLTRDEFLEVCGLK